MKEVHNFSYKILALKSRWADEAPEIAFHTRLRVSQFLRVVVAVSFAEGKREMSTGQTVPFVGRVPLRRYAATCC
jgi:hypothetical protein